MEKVTPQEAVAHPNWNMGAKISVDSATMMNKGLEIIEACHLFRVPVEKIEVLIHPQSIVHSAVSYKDGSVLAHMGMPDMRTPISYALAWPERMEAPTARLDLTKMTNLSFFAPDENRFPALHLAKQCQKTSQSATAVMNAANEMAVDAFLKGKIGFLDIVRVSEKVVESSPLPAVATIQDVISLDHEAREMAKHYIAERMK